MKLEEVARLTGLVSRSSEPESQLAVQEALEKLGYEPGSFYQELEMSHRFVDTHQDVSYTNTAVQLHSHTFYEVLCCRNTCGVEYLVGADRYRLQRGDIILVPPGISHRPLLPEVMTEPYRRDVLWVSQEFMSTIFRVFPQGLEGSMSTRLIRTAGTRWEYLMQKFRQGVKEAERRDVGWEAALTANTLQILVQLSRAALEQTMPLRAEKPELLDLALAYVEENLGEKITLAEVAKHFYVSESTVSQTFRKKMGVSFYRCVSQRRLIAAKTFIEEGVLLEEVSRRVGFADYSAFYRAFRQEFGISPRQYRNKYQGNG